ncbi:MAG: glycosyltransferase [Verrucomicrobia bacterium]|nr:glycosyltransferase [Verrucomicrobiota bacterium]
MRIHKQSKLASPKVSLILLDWSVRESFHICHYLKNQTVPRDQFEVILVEYYSALSSALLQFEDEFDTIAALEMPDSNYYHKHLMYNIGFLLSKGEIIVICDSDAMAKPTFIESIIKGFETNPNIYLHIDQFRNSRKDMYPFNYPTFDEVSGEGCINWANGITTGVAATSDILHQRNYGACFCCKRKDYIAIGGADEHIDFVGHICGPYDMTFRLSNLGKVEVWHRKEFLYHTWHPGSAGVDNYFGPSDGMYMSSTALEHIATGCILPHVINPLLIQLQNGKSVSFDEICKNGISKDNFEITSLELLNDKERIEKKAKETHRATFNDAQLFTSQATEIKLSDISTVLRLCPPYTSKDFLKPAPNFLSSFSMNISLLIHCAKAKSRISDNCQKTTTEASHASSIPHKSRISLPPFAYFILKASKLLLLNPKKFIDKWNDLMVRYQKLKGLVKKFPAYFMTLKNGTDASQKTVIFAGSDHQVEFLRTRLAAFELTEKSEFNITPFSHLKVESFDNYKDKLYALDVNKCLFTKSALIHLNESENASKESIKQI